MIADEESLEMSAHAAISEVACDSGNKYQLSRFWVRHTVLLGIHAFLKSTGGLWTTTEARSSLR